MSNPFHDISDTIGAAAVTKYQLVITAGALVVATGPTVEAVGVVQDGYAIGALANVRVFGVTKAIAAGVISALDPLMPAAAGEVDTHGGVATDVHVGFALTAAAAQGDIIDIFLYANKTNAQA